MNPEYVVRFWFILTVTGKEKSQYGFIMEHFTKLPFVPVSGMIFGEDDDVAGDVKWNFRGDFSVELTHWTHSIDESVDYFFPDPNTEMKFFPIDDPIRELEEIRDDENRSEEQHLAAELLKKLTERGYRYDG